MFLIKKILLAFALLLLPASGSFASVVSPDAALADAEIVLRTIDMVAQLAVPREFEAEFGKPLETRNMGENVYRNLDWQVPLVSADLSLDLHVGFNYGKRAEWSMSIRLGGADAGRRYFVALCRGLERLTGHVSHVVRFEQTPAVTSVNAYYPLAAPSVLAVTTTDGDASGKIVLMPAPLAAAGYFTLRVTSGDAPLHKRPDAASPVLRTLPKGHAMISIEQEQSGENDAWHRVRDNDGEIGWVRIADVTPVGISDLDHAF